MGAVDGPTSVAILSERTPLRPFLWSRFAGQTALNALLYALLIAVVERSDSGLAGTLLVATFLVPSILLGVPGGALADAFPKRPLLLVALLLRAAVAAALFWWTGDLWSLYLLALALATVGQVFAPAEAALVPLLVPPQRLARVNAAMQLVLLAAQVLGGVALAPLILKLAGARPVFALAAGLFVVAAWQMAGVRIAAEPPPDSNRRRGLRGALAAGWHAMVDDATVLRALVQLTLVGTVVKVLVAVAPLLARDMLGIAAANAVYVMAPAAVGGGLGLLIAPPLAHLLGRSRMAMAGFFLFAIGTMALALAAPIGDWLTAIPRLRFGAIEEITRVPGAVTVAMALALVLGLAFALVSVAVRTLVNERAPRHLQGRVFATQLTLADAASLLPLLAAGALADVAGVGPVLFGAGALCLVGEVAARRFGSGRASTHHTDEVGGVEFPRDR